MRGLTVIAWLAMACGNKQSDCEADKKLLAGEKAKGRCIAEADEAAAIVCSSETAPHVHELAVRCSGGGGGGHAGTSSTDLRDTTKTGGGTECRALDPGDRSKVLARASDPEATKCVVAVHRAVQAAMCLGDRTNKHIDYIVEFDHVVLGTDKKQPDIKTAAICLH